MNGVLDNFKYLKSLFPSDYVASLSEDSFLYRLLVEQRPELDTWRQHINGCLELAYRYDLVDADLEARLKKGDWEIWEAAISELKVAKFIEGHLGIDNLQWHPKGRKRKVGEFEIILSSLNVPIFVEVKTILPRDLENLEQRVYDKLRNCIKEVALPFAIIIHLESAGETENFSERYLKKFLAEELSKLSTEDLAKIYELPDYQDRTGLHLQIHASASTKHKNCYLGACSFNARQMNGSDYARHSLNKAYTKLKGTHPCLVILCPSPNHLVDEDDMLNAWLGTETFVITFGGDGSVINTKTTRKPDGFFQNRPKISAVGLYKEDTSKEIITGNLELYHNPLAANPLSESIFRGRGARQLVRKNEAAMEWIE